MNEPVLIKGKNRFNSTLVQLKGGVQYSQDISKNSFNSTLVQLKASCPTQKKRKAQSFNSTLVQLKVIFLLKRF